MERLRAHFLTHDFSAQTSGYKFKNAPSEKNQMYIKAKGFFPSIKRLIIWIEDTTNFEESWDVLLSENADTVYPAHGRPFTTSDLAKYKKHISKLRLYKLN